MNQKIALLLLPVAFASLSAEAKVWNAANNPSLLDKNYEYRLDALPKGAELAVKPWSNTYWPTFEGSINKRWNQAEPDGFRYQSPLRAQVLQMTDAQLATLAPSEKFDLLLGHYDYPLKKSVSGYTSPREEYWRGLCDGWSMSAVQFAEPKPVTLKNPDGVAIPFGSSDVKALLSYYAQMQAEVSQVYVGEQCWKTGIFARKGSCDNINAGAMHVILANEIGIKKTAFMMDRDPGKEIWNQPVYGFKSEQIGSATGPTGRAVLMHTFMTYTDEIEKSSWTPVNGTNKFKMDTMEMEYTLDLDSAGHIVGGSFSEDSDNPDTFWKPDGPIKFEDEFVRLKDLVK